MRKYRSVNRSYGSSYRNTTSRKKLTSSPGYRKSSGKKGSDIVPSVLTNKRLLLIIAAAVIAVVIIICVSSNTTDEEQNITLDGVLADNVTIHNVSVGGMDVSQAKIALASVCSEIEKNAVLYLEVPDSEDGSADVVEDGEGIVDTENSDGVEEDVQKDIPTTDLSSGEMIDASEGMQIVDYPSEKSGVYADIDSVIAGALDYSESYNKMSDEEKEAEGQKNFDIAFAVDKKVLDASLATDAPAWSIEPVSSSFGLETSSDENDLTTSATVVTKEAEDGVDVDIEAFSELIVSRVEQQNISDLITAPTVIIHPESNDDIISQYEIIGEYTTEYSTDTLAKANRTYNIWKISDILNGCSIPAGETFSVNDVVGPRTEANGWKLASGIENGQYTDQAGGGICQVSTTLYIAALKAEMKIVERTHHTIPSSYVPIGLDATISTDDPDLQIQNNTEYPMYIGIYCSAPDKNVKVRLYGIKPRDYTLRFESKVIETIPAIETQYIADKSVPEGTFVEEGSSRDGYVVEVYKIWYDKDSGDETERKRIYTDKYKAMGKKVKYNPNTPPDALLQEQEPSEPVVPEDNPTEPVVEPEIPTE